MTRRLRSLAIALIAASAIESVAVRTPWIAPRVLALSHGAVYVDQGDVVRQRSNRDCGVAALAMILAHYGRGENSLDSLRALTERQRGLSFADLQRAAAAYSLAARGWILPAGQLGAIATPAILHFPNHYMVLDSIRQRWAYLRDPAIGRVRMRLGMLAWRSTRRVLVFTVSSIVLKQTGVTPSIDQRPNVRLSSSMDPQRELQRQVRATELADSADFADLFHRTLSPSRTPATSAVRVNRGL